MLLGNFEKASLINSIQQEKKEGEELFVHERSRYDDESGGQPTLLNLDLNIQKDSQQKALKSILKKPTNFSKEDMSPGSRKKKRNQKKSEEEARKRKRKY